MGRSLQVIGTMGPESEAFKTPFGALGLDNGMNGAGALVGDGIDLELLQLRKHCSGRRHPGDGSIGMQYVVIHASQGNHGADIQLPA